MPVGHWSRTNDVFLDNEDAYVKQAEDRQKGVESLLMARPDEEYKI